MNLINCSEPCVHQRDGYCTLERAASISSADNICGYYAEKVASDIDRGTEQ